MLYYIKRYPLSLSIILVVVYLSFFQPPSTEISHVPYFDKAVHLCMYFSMSAILWLEFLRAHKKGRKPLWHAWVGAMACPILFGGLIELLQEYCTTYRGGEWLDFAADAAGVVLASLIGHYALRHRWMEKS